ncbi:MAG: PriCT-2 domain-containing protein [Hydrogenophaga sp.]|nr:PriCT-2 domain-containing protein [Hydrogenophaga sp.]
MNIINKVTSGLTPPKDLKAPSPKPTAPALTAPSSFVDSQKTIAASSSTEKQTQAKALLEALWRSNTEVHQIGYLNKATKKFKNTPVKDINDAVSNAFAKSDAGFESYFAIAEYITPNSRIAANVSGAYGYWADFDVSAEKAIAGKGYKTIEEAKAKVMQFCEGAGIPEPTHFVNSGGGFHVYWVTDSFIDRDTWQKFAKMLKALTKSLKCLADDTRTADITSVLRVPGTLNHKYDPPRLVELTHASDKFIELDTMLNGIARAHERFCEAEVTTVKPSNIEHLNVGTAKAEIHETPQNIDNVKSALAVINPDCEREKWFKTCCAIRSLNWACSEDLARAWSKGEYWSGTNQTATKYDAQAFNTLWQSIKSDAGISIGTLMHYAKQDGWVDASSFYSDDKFDICETIVIEPEQQSQKQSVVTANPLDKFSLRGRSAELEKNALAEVFVLGQLALMGEITVFFAAPNTGKTVISLRLLVNAIKEGHIDPNKVYYLNMDDSGSGVIMKNRIAEEYNFHMLTEGFEGFSAIEFLNIVRGMIENNQAHGVIIILDTLKKFTDVMDNTKSSIFTGVMRAFAMNGGTVIALAHTNKNAGKDGKPIYGGVSSIMNDIDCAYTIAQVTADNGEKIVEFNNTKRRGNVVQNAAYSYSIGNNIPYDELLLSVQLVDETQLGALKNAEEIKSDAEVIQVALVCINEGLNTKMKLAFAIAERAGISKGNAIKLIDKYTGNDAMTHIWSFSVAARGAKIFTLLNSVTDNQ